MHFKKQTSVSTPSKEQRSILRRVANMPLVSSTYDMVATAYNSTKNNHSYAKPLWDVAEKGIKTITEAAVHSAQPILTKLEPQIATANEYVHKSLDTLEEKLPILQMTADKVASNTKEMVSAKMANAKDSIANTLSGAVSLTKGAVQNSMAIPKSVIHHSLTTVAVTKRIAVDGAKALLLTSEMLVDNYIPISDEELRVITEAHDKAFEEWIKNRPKVAIEDMIPEEDVIIIPGPEQVEQGYLGRLGTLLRKLRLRAIHHSVGRINLRNIKTMIGNYHFRLQQRFYRLRAKFPILNKGAPQPVGLMWLDPNRFILEPNVDKDEGETQTLTIIQQLQIACQMLVSSIQGFPSSLQDRVRQIPQSIGELHTTFQELPSTLLARNHEKILMARGYMDELVHYIAFDTPLYWLLSEYVALYWPYVNRETDEDYPTEAMDDFYTNETESELEESELEESEEEYS